MNGKLRQPRSIVTVNGRAPPSHGQPWTFSVIIPV